MNKIVMKKDKSVIPPGEFCYRVVPLGAGESISDDIERFGRDLREFRYHGAYKEVLCPYWHRTEQDTVRCEYLDKEYYDDSYPKQAAGIKCQTPGTGHSARLEYSWEILDEIKICGINDQEEDDWGGQ